MTALLLLLLASQADEKAARKALDTFAAAYKSKDAAARAAAVAGLAKTDHEKVVARLGQLLAVDVKEVRLAAAEGLGGIQEQKRKAILALSNGIAPNAQSPDVVRAIHEALEKLQAGAGHAVLKALFLSTNADAAKAAIDRAGETREKTFVVPLIDLVQRLEGAAREAQNVGPGGRSVTGGGLLGGVGGPGVDPDAPKRAKIVVPAAYKALEAITGEKFKTPKEWVEWYKKNAADYRQ